MAGEREREGDKREKECRRGMREVGSTAESVGCSEPPSSQSFIAMHARREGLPEHRARGRAGGAPMWVRPPGDLNNSPPRAAAPAMQGAAPLQPPSTRSWSC